MNTENPSPKKKAKGFIVAVIIIAAVISMIVVFTACAVIGWHIYKNDGERML